MKLVLVRECRAQMSEENKFMGWTDSPLSILGQKTAHAIGKKLGKLNIEFGIAYTSLLSRATKTLDIIEEELNREIKTRRTYKLNAKHYGVLEGKNKDEARYMYGDDQIAKWRRGLDERPPEIVITDPRFPGNDPKYSDILKFELPLAESEKDVYDRVIDYFEHEVSTFLKVGENVLIVSHGSPLRMLIKYLENVPDNDTFEIEEGTVIVYDLTDELEITNKMIIDNL